MPMDAEIKLIHFSYAITFLSNGTYTARILAFDYEDACRKILEVHNESRDKIMKLEIVRYAE